MRSAPRCCQWCLVLESAWVAVLVPGGNVIDVWGMPQPFVWCQSWSQASRHIVVLSTGTWWCLGVLHVWHIVPSPSQQEGWEWLLFREWFHPQWSVCDGWHNMGKEPWEHLLCHQAIQRWLCLWGHSGVGHPKQQLGSHIFLSIDVYMIQRDIKFDLRCIPWWVPGDGICNSQLCGWSVPDGKIIVLEVKKHMLEMSWGHLPGSWVRSAQETCGHFLW